jgi:hypothetical protein
MTRSYRWGPAAGIVAIVLIVVAFIVGGSSPDTQGSDADIAKFLASSSDLHRNEAALLISLVGILFLFLFFAALRSRLAADVRYANYAATAYGAGVISAVFLFMAFTGFVAPLFAATDARHTAGTPALNPAFYRFSNDFGYAFWIAAGAFGAIAVWTTTAAAFRGFLPKWFAWVGVVLGLAALVAIFFVPMFGYGLWIIIAGILLVMRPEPAVVTTPIVTTPVA